MTETIDNFYTPAWLAEIFAAFLPAGLSGGVLDPTVGAGALLRAVQDRFGDRVTPLGIDIHPAVVRQLRVAEPEWVVSNADLLIASSRRNSKAWRLAKSNLAAVVINPPFSHRGMGGAIVSYGTFEGRVAPAMHFVVELLTHLSPREGYLAILPDGAFEAERHRALWAEIERQYLVERLDRFKANSFNGARVSTSLIRLTNGQTPNVSSEQPQIRPSNGGRCTCVEVIRGRVPVHTLRGGISSEPVPFLHTTNLLHHPSAGGLVGPMRLADQAPLVILTRVGRWSRPIIVDIGRVVLSDCLIGVRPRMRTELHRLRKSIDSESLRFQAGYRGTGAQYLTLDALVTRLQQIGWHPHVVKASQSISSCCCGYNGSACGEIFLGSIAGTDGQDRESSQLAAGDILRSMEWSANPQ